MTTQTLVSTTPEPKFPTFWRNRLFLGTIGITLLAIILTVTPLGQGLLNLVAPYGDKAAWYLARSSGVVAYGLFGVSTVIGLLMSTKLVKQYLPAPVLFQAHQTASWVGLGTAALHGILMLFDGYFNFTIANILIPFTGPYAPVWVGLGIISWYILGLVNVSFSFRKRIGQKNWRRLHYLTFIGFILMTLHGIFAGSDTASLVMTTMYAGFGGSVLFLTLFRILAALDR